MPEVEGVGVGVCACVCANAHNTHTYTHTSLQALWQPYRLRRLQGIQSQILVCMFSFNLPILSEVPPPSIGHSVPQLRNLIQFHQKRLLGVERERATQFKEAKGQIIGPPTSEIDFQLILPFLAPLSTATSRGT